MKWLVVLYLVTPSSEALKSVPVESHEACQRYIREHLFEARVDGMGHCIDMEALVNLRPSPLSRSTIRSR